MKSSFICAFVFLGLVAFAAPRDVFAASVSKLSSVGVNASANKEKDLGTYGLWHTYSYEEGGQTVCYMVTTKSVKPPNQKKYRTSYLMITHRPIEASIDVFSYGSGVVLDSKHGVSVQVGKTSFDLFSVRDTAWARDAITDHKLAEALRTSSSAQLEGITSEGRAATINDKFDLSGAMSAYRAINKACGLPDPEAKKLPVKKAPAQKAVIKKSHVKKAVAKTPPTKKAPVKKTASKKHHPKKAAAKKAPAAQKTAKTAQ